MNRVKALLAPVLSHNVSGPAIRASIPAERLGAIASGKVKISSKEAGLIAAGSADVISAKLLLQLNKDDLATKPQTADNPTKTTTSKSSSVSARGQHIPRQEW